MMLSRRNLLGASALVPAAICAANDRVNVGIIGSGLRAMFEARQYPFFGNTEIVAVADAQESRRVEAKATLEALYSQQRAGGNRGIRMYADFRELLAQKDIDAVYICSPDHWHVPMLIPALKAGKHVHLEKPLGLSVEQDIAARRAVRKYGKVFQYGAESRSTPITTKGIELVLNGRIGKVTQVYAVAPGSLAGGKASPVISPPKGFDYDAWLGPAPFTPFCADRCLTESPRGIFNISDYSLGNIANWGAHPLDQYQRWADNAGRATVPVSFAGSGSFATGGLYDCATRWNVECSYADGFKLHFVDNRTYHELPDVPHPDRAWGRDAAGNPNRVMPNGVVFIGTEGWLIVNYNEVVAERSAILDSQFENGAVRLHNSALAEIPAGMSRGTQQVYTAGHHQDWIRAIRTGSPVVDDIESAYRSDMISQLSELCLRTGAPLRWNEKKLTIEGNAAARQRMSRPMRGDWKLA